MTSLVLPLAGPSGPDRATAVDYFVPGGEANELSQVLTAYLHSYTAAGSLVLDPFCHSPDIVRETVASQRRIISISFNPLDALRTRLALSTIPAREVEAAVTRLGDSPKAGVPLRQHLQRLYRTTCAQCGKEVIADYFIWERGYELPRRVHYHCPACGDAGLRDCNENDAHILQEVQPRGLHYYHILERVVGRESHAKKLTASLLELYTPRNLYVLSNILLKIENLFSGSGVYDYLRLGLLRALEQASKLNPVPGEPAPLHAPGLRPLPHFVEWNAWQLFEESTRQLGQNQPPAPIALAAGIQELLPPGQPPSAEARSSTSAPQSAMAFVGHMTVRELAKVLPPASVSLIWAQPPSQGHTQWALPYLWTGWLYGSEEAAPLWPLVRRRSSDWAWYLQAMRGALLALKEMLQADGHVVLLSQSKGLAQHETLALAAAGASLRLENMLYCSREPETATSPFGGLRGDHRSVWVPGPSTPPFPMTMAGLTTRLQELAVAAAEETLQARGEAAPFARLHCHIWEALARRGVLQRVMLGRELPSTLDWVREQIQQALQNQVGPTFVQVWADEPVPAEGAAERECLWWLALAPDVPPLSERIERAVYETLVAAGPVALSELLIAVYARFPGMLTPDREWVLACLKSYGQQVAGGRWALREGERPSERAQARDRVLYVLQDLGQRWGYEVKRAEHLALRWIQGEKQPVVWAILDTAALSTLLDAAAGGLPAGARKLAVIHDARQDLIRLSWTRSPLLRRKLVGTGWQFIHAEDLYHWSSQHKITPADLDTLVSLDPLAIRQRTQLPLM